MKGHFLTEVFNLFLTNISYFNTKNYTLKRPFLFAALVSSVLTLSAQSYNNIEFIENKGQWDSQVRYKGEVSNGAFFLRSNGFTVLQHNPVDYQKLATFLHGQIDGRLVRPEDKVVLRSHAWNVDFIGASGKSQVVPDKIVQTYNNYFVGNDPSKWTNECHLYQAVTLKEVYPNIDVRYYTDKGFLKYDIIVKPGGDVSRIALKYEGVEKLQVKNRELNISTSLGELKESHPYTYQTGIDGRKEVSCRYIVKDNIVRFDIKNYDPTSTLVIDPVVIFCSFAGSRADNWGFTATYGADGSLFGGGIVLDSDGFPTSTGAFQTTFQGGTSGGNGQATDIGIIKLSPDGRNRIYATYIGGSGNEQPHSLVADAQGNLVVAGRTTSTNYPVVNNGTVAGTGFDIVVTKLNAAGTALIGSRKIGGGADDGVNITASRSKVSLQQNYGDDGRSEVILDGAGNVYVASCTQSGNFPVTPGVFQGTYGGGNQDGVLLKLNANLSTILFSSFIGGSANDAAYVLSLGPTGDIYVAGGTESGNLRGNTAGTIGASNNGGIDGFISIINNNGTAVTRTAYVGTSGIDQIFGVQFDRLGFPYIMGQTTGTWQVRNATYSNAGGKQFIAKLEPDLSNWVYSTCFGSGAANPNISPVAFLVDRCENVYISGWGGFFGNSNEFASAGTGGLPVTADAFQSTTDGKDFYFFVLQRNATAQLFGSFFGEDNSNNGGTDHVDGGTSRFDAEGVIYQAICGNCNLGAGRPNYDEITPGVWSETNPSSNCNLVMVRIAMNLAGVSGGVQSAIDGSPRDTAGCLPLTVDFTDTIGNAQTYEWHFNYVPGNPPDTITTVPSATHTYTAIGTYQVMLVAVDPNTCNVRDSSFLHIRVGDLRANLAANFTKLPPCTGFLYQFDNLSTTDISRPFTDTSFKWDFGDGSPQVVRGLASIQHTFPGPGLYNVKLILKDTGYCNNPDTLEIPVSVDENVRARFRTDSVGCLVYNAVFDNTSIAGQTWLWDFGDGTTSTAFEPVHTYTDTGTYTIVLIAYNPNTCNLSDTTRYTIRVYDAPVPDFSFTPVQPIVNTPNIFTNLSSPDAIRFKWDFGDGDSLITTSRAPVTHQFNATGTFNVCLTAYNSVGCDSTICRPVDAIIEPVVDVPNAFTPQSGDINSIVKVRGFGIAKMQFVIWNRWGQKVFESNNVEQGWNGRVNGAIQPMDVYAYTLSIEFSDGTKTTKKGDITLIR